MSTNTQQEIKVFESNEPLKKDTLCVTLYGGPGTGKSVQQALIFARLKIWGVDAMMSMEAAKRYVYNGSAEIKTQEGLFGDQLRELELLNGKCEVIVCEAPLLFNIIYDRIYGNGDNIDFHRQVANKYRQFNNMDFLFTRTHKYQREGRYQDEEGALKVDQVIREVLRENAISPIEIAPYEESAIIIARQIMERLGKVPPL